MTTQEIRDRLVTKRAEYQSVMIAVENACNEINEIRSKITEDDRQVLIAHGVDISSILQIDVEKCKEDEEYLESCKNSIHEIVNKLHEILEGELNV